MRYSVVEEGYWASVIDSAIGKRSYHYFVVDNETGQRVKQLGSLEEANAQADYMNQQLGETKTEEERTRLTEMLGTETQEYKDAIKGFYGKESKRAEKMGARRTGELVGSMERALLASGTDPAKIKAMMGRLEGGSDRNIADILETIDLAKTGKLAEAEGLDIKTGLSIEDLTNQRQRLTDAMTQFYSTQAFERDKFQAELDAQPEWYESFAGGLGDLTGDLAMAYATYKVGTAGGGGTCFDGNSMVHGVSKDIPIHLLKKGDAIRTTNGFKPVKEVYEYDRVSDLSINDVRVTGSHPFIMNDGSLKLSKDIEEGDMLWGNHPVLSVKNEKGSGKVYNLDIESDTYHVEGMLVHTGRKGS